MDEISKRFESFAKGSEEFGSYKDIGDTSENELENKAENLRREMQKKLRTDVICTVGDDNSTVNFHFCARSENKKDCIRLKSRLNKMGFVTDMFAQDGNYGPLYHIDAVVRKQDIDNVTKKVEKSMGALLRGRALGLFPSRVSTSRL